VLERYFQQAISTIAIIGPIMQVFRTIEIGAQVTHLV
jgi:hypothetical protein